MASFGEQRVTDRAPPGGVSSGRVRATANRARCRISTSRSQPVGNAACESWTAMLKNDDAYRQQYRDLADARASIARFIVQDYHRTRRHSALGYRLHVEFEKALPAGA